MQKYLYITFLIFLFTSCSLFEEIDLVGVDNFKMGKLESKQINFSLDVKVNNPNFYGINIKPSTVDVFVNDEIIAKAYLDEKIKLTRKKEDTYHVPLHAELVDGAMFKIMKLAFKSKVVLKISGKVKGSVLGIPKKVEINESKEIDGSKLNFFNKND